MLLVHRESLFVLDFRFHVGDRVVVHDVKRDRLPRQRPHGDLHGEDAAVVEVEESAVLDGVVHEREARVQPQPAAVVKVSNPEPYASSSSVSSSYS